MANQLIRLFRDGVQVAQATANSHGRAIFSVDTAGWSEQVAVVYTATAEDVDHTLPVSLVSTPVSVQVRPTLWADSFDRADGAPGNGWGGEAVITNNAFVTSGAAGYSCRRNPCDGVALPADYWIRVRIPHSMVTKSFWGVAGRVGVNNHGFQFMRHLNDVWRAGNSNTWDIANPVVITGGIPASWSVNQSHSVAVRFVGNRGTLYLDGREYGYSDFTVNAGVAGLGVALTGEAGATFLEVRVSAASF